MSIPLIYQEHPKEASALGRSALAVSERMQEGTAATFHSSLDHFTNRITRYVDKKLGRETELAEVGQ